MTQSSKDPILVAGGGIGGLAAAIALAQDGHNVQIVEQAPEFCAIGFGIQLGPNVFPMLDRLGVGDPVRHAAFHPSAIAMLDALDGQTLVNIPAGSSLKRRFGNPYVVIIRSDLHQILVERCAQLPNITMHTNFLVTGIERSDDAVTLTSSSGERLHGSALIGADGLKSLVRSTLRQEGEPDFTGYVAHRTMVPTKDLPSALYRDDVVLWAGPGFHIVHYPLRGASLFNIVAVFQTPSFNAQLSPSQLRDELIATYAEAHPHMRQLIGLVDFEKRWSLSDRSPTRDWTSGNLALLGDAAHPTLQSIAQGACMAIEDAVTLADAIAVHDNFPTAFAAYNRARYLRTARVQLVSRHMWEVYHETGIAREVRNAQYREQTVEQSYDCLQWLWGGKDQTETRAQAQRRRA